MKIRDLLSQLNDLPIGALDKDIYFENGIAGNLQIHPVTKECDDPEVLGYIIVEVEREPVQLELPFFKIPHADGFSDEEKK
jgi:hypothetical protein